MRNKPEREVKEKIKKSSKNKDFIDRNGNHFAVTDQGLLYCPKASGAKKHSCPDCYFCQWCSDSRCGLCRRDPQPCPGGKGSSD